MSRPLAIDLFAGLGGWAEGLLAEGYYVVGFDIERHEYGEHRYPGQLVVQDVLKLHGKQFRNATLIVASPPCQEYSYMAMPWRRAKAKAAAIRADATGAELERLNRLFNACFRIQKEASIAAMRHVPMIVENVKGAQPWVGRSRWNFGSFHLWGDVPALMPVTFNGIKAPGMNWSNQEKRGQDFTRLAGKEAVKNAGGSWFRVSHNNVPHSRGDAIAHTPHMTNPTEHHASGAVWFDTGPASLPSSSLHRKAASAMIAKIPMPLARHIAATFR